MGIVDYDLESRGPRGHGPPAGRGPQVLLLHSTVALVWDVGRHTDCRDKLYTALAFAGLKTGFITERQLEQGQVPEAPVVFVPDVVHLSEPAAAALPKVPGQARARRGRRRALPR